MVAASLSSISGSDIDPSFFSITHRFCLSFSLLFSIFRAITYLNGNRKGKTEKTALVSIGSDGLDNTDAAGAIACSCTLKHIKNLNHRKYLKNNNAYPLLKKGKSLIFTGATGTNVADLMLVLKR